MGCEPAEGRLGEPAAAQEDRPDANALVEGGRLRDRQPDRPRIGVPSCSSTTLASLT
jgi:hypothetical protein